MTNEPDPGHVAKSWVHAHEEDAAGQMVFRPADYDFAPARAPRLALELSPDGGLRYGGPGPADAHEWSGGRWELEGSELTVQVEGGPPRRYAVEHVDEERLVLRPGRDDEEG